MEVVLLEPNNPSTLLSATLQFSGKIRGSSQRPGSLTLNISGRDTRYTSVNWAQEGADWSFRGTIPVEELIPKSESDRQDYVLKAECSSEGHIVESNTTTFTVAPQKSWNDPLGGFLFPKTLEIDTPDLVVEGWAAKRGCRVASVTISIGRTQFPATSVGVWSPPVARSLPDLEEAKSAIFSVGLSRKQLAHKLGRLSVNRNLSLSARINFSDGSSFAIVRPAFRWRGPLYNAIFGLSEEPVPGPVPAPRSIVFVTNNLRPTEGAPRVLMEVVRAAKKITGNSPCHVISPYFGALRESLEDLGATVHILPELQLLHYRRREDFIEVSRPAVDLLKRLNPELVFGNTNEAFWAIHEAQADQRKTAWLIHESISPYGAFNQLDPQVRIEYLSALRKADRLLFVSQATQNLYENPKNSAVIPNAVDLAAIASKRPKDRKTEGDPIILCVGTVCERKGQNLLVEALAALRELSWSCLLVGGRASPFQRELEDRLRTLGLENRISIVPETPEVDRYYASARIAVIASREESAPLVSLEALAWGIPLVSTDAFGLKEQLEGSGAAILVPAGSVERLSAAMRQLLTDQEQWETFHRQGPAWIERHFSFARTMQSYQREIEELLSPAR